jgi:predicted SAM-dependent methyltransferase
MTGPDRPDSTGGLPGPLCSPFPPKANVNPILARLFGTGRSQPSLQRLLAEEPGLAGAFLWKANRLPARLPDPLWLHIGCGERVLEEFLNLDFLPGDARVAEWDLLDPWPERWPLPASGAFSEDTLEHFFLAEQLYILCEMNRVLAPGAVFRVLMPSYARLLEYCRGFTPRPGEFLHSTFGVETEADAVNAGLRFSGHRWLHDDASLAHLARLAGFEAVKTTCAQSTVPFLSGRNLREEEGTAAFAHDLVKSRSLRRVVVPPSSLRDVEVFETVAEGIGFGELRAAGAKIEYRLPDALRVADIACINARGANLSSFREHSLKRLVFRGDRGEGAWSLDETLKSKSGMNLALPSALALACGGRDAVVSEVALEPGKPGDRVTVGPLEIFAYEPLPA